MIELTAPLLASCLCITARPLHQLEPNSWLIAAQGHWWVRARPKIIPHSRFLTNLAHLHFLSHLNTNLENGQQSNLTK
ncbi:unnamed protein product [Parascedosporium putredinis]|uniref:Uncharacterized protein n=1 Tax=Parascedosporium putredinis TaxID=1442378 RepID=A0A9P1HB51_9PEZI|nr:unnamed protein product [Parascedosporium putredinis]CAI8002383.1 unnamed protein product [Parascedosporium putredinis]